MTTLLDHPPLDFARRVEMAEALCRWAHSKRWKGGWRATRACLECSAFTDDVLAPLVNQ